MLDSAVMERIDGGAAYGAALRTVVIASADAGLRQRLRNSLGAMRWKVLEAGGGAEAFAQIEGERPEALLVDSWLPDLEMGSSLGKCG